MLGSALVFLRKDMERYLEKKIEQLEKEADWLAKQIDFNCPYGHQNIKVSYCKNDCADVSDDMHECWREAARIATSKD